ncbi:MAG: ORF6N domain-containing protein [Treponema sp.]|nr:ORF6N domain-containing protein [Treponema sp.]
MEKELQKIKSLIFEVRGRQVMLDEDLAKIYQVETKVFNQTVKRNLDRFPPEFMFQLTEEENKSLRSQNVTSKNGRGGRRYLPFAFTEHGVVMLSSVLNSKIATKINIAVVNAFIDMRHYALVKPDTNLQITELRKLLMLHIENTDKRLTEHDEAISKIIRALNNLIEQPPKTIKIGFTAKEKSPGYLTT